MNIEDDDFQSEQARVVAAYTERLRVHGKDVRSLNWGSKASQESRFEVLLEAGIQSGMSVLDVGCGLGDFYQWTIDRGIDIRYSGLDVTPGMVDSCKDRFPENDFHCGDITEWLPENEPVYDFVIASGIFYDRPASGYQYMQKAVRSMFRISRIGIAFNAITALADKADENEFLPRVGELAELASTLTKSFVLRHDYHPCDATMYLYKKEN